MAKKKEFSKVSVDMPYCVWRKSGGAETGNTFAKPNKRMKYVRILALCLVPTPAAVIYPNTKHPLMHQVRDMCRAGLMERLVKEGDRKFYYRTTRKGKALVSKAMGA